MAIKRINSSFKYALASKNVGITQLAYHAKAYVYSKCTKIHEALKIAHDGVKYLNKHFEIINKTPSILMDGGSAELRLAGLYNLITYIYVDLKQFKKAIYYNNEEYKLFE